MRGLSRHAVARYRKGAGCVSHGGRTAPAAEEKRMKACLEPGGAKPPAEPFLTAFTTSGSRLNRYRYRFRDRCRFSPSGSLSFLSLSFSFDPDPDSDFDSDALSNIQQGTRIRKQKKDPVCAANRATPWRATEKAPDAFHMEGGRPRPPYACGKARRTAARLHKQAYIPAVSGDGGPCFAEAASQGKPAAIQFGNLPVPEASLHAGRR